METDRDLFLKILYLLVAAVLFKNISAVHYLVADLGSVIGVILVFAYFILGAIFILRSLTDIKVSSNQRLLIATSAVFLSTYIAVLFFNPDFQEVKADFKLFSLNSAQILLDGVNPYSATMPTDVGLKNLTPNVLGAFVEQFSYPALAFLVFVPQVALGIYNLSWTVMIFFTAIYAFLVNESPSELKFLPFVMILANTDIVNMALVGSFTPLWMLPLLFSMKYWKEGKDKASAVALGISFAFKQVAWFIAPFLAIWLYRENDLATFKKKIKNYAVYGGATFFTFNLPFIIWNPVAWVQGVFTPLGSTGALYPRGVGFSVLNVFGVVSLPNIYFHFAFLGAFAVSLGLYYLNFDRLKWAAWLSPMFILWFNYRSLENYFAFFILVSYYALLLKTGNRDKKSVFNEFRKLF